MLGGSALALTAPANDPKAKRLDLAARAAWLYYIKGHTQDEIATEMGVSRPNAQRLVALAISEGLIKFRLDHPLLQAIELAERMRKRFGLDLCEIAPSAATGVDSRVGAAILAAQIIEGYATSREPKILAFGTGRALVETVRQLPLMARPEHRIVSLVGNISRDGRASPYDVAMRLSDRIGAQCYPLPVPVITDTLAECEILRAQRGYQIVADLFENADLVMVGVGSIGDASPVVVDGFLTGAEMCRLERDGAVGELISRSFDARGALVENDVTARLTAMRMRPNPARPVIVVATGPEKVGPLLAVMRGRFATGVVTDERTAAALLERAA
jgi:DNA-binding transcriptional regulator LsrR (DeoR family)